LLLPGSGVSGLENLRQLVEHAAEAKACLLCLNHRSNLDVPILQALLEDCGEDRLFQQIIWIAGRKLEEDVGMTSLLVQCFHRVIVTPPSWFASPHSADEIHQARLINMAADRAIATLRQQGWVFALFPAGTRQRPHDPSTRLAIEQTDSYLKMFDYLTLGNIDGCTLPVTMDRDFTHETPRLDRMLYTFGPVQRTDKFRAEAATRFTKFDQRTATAASIMREIDRLAPETSCDQS
jgi:glycerol-3-phosphate O-acyltransferase